MSAFFVLGSNSIRLSATHSSVLTQSLDESYDGPFHNFNSHVVLRSDLTLSDLVLTDLFSTSAGKALPLL